MAPVNLTILFNKAITISDFKLKTWSEQVLSTIYEKPTLNFLLILFIIGLYIFMAAIMARDLLRRRIYRHFDRTSE
jgi:hypothetical protein